MNKKQLLRWFTTGILLAALVVLSRMFGEDIFHFIGAAFCHQFPGRSPVTGGLFFPFCYRCAGLFWGILISTLFLLITGWRPRLLSTWPILFFAFSLGFFILDILNGTPLVSLTLYPDRPILRLVSGFALGASLPLWVIPAYEIVGTQNPRTKPEKIGFNLRSVRLPLFHLFFCAFFAWALVIILSSKAVFCYTAGAFLCCLSAVGFLSILYSTLIQLVGIYRNKVIPVRESKELGLICSLTQIILFSTLHQILITIS